MEKPRKTSRRQFLTLEFKNGSALNSQNLNGNPKIKKRKLNCCSRLKVL